LTSATNILKHYWRYVCFDKATALCDILYKRLRNTLIYLLTLLTLSVNNMAAIPAVFAIDGLQISDK